MAEKRDDTPAEKSAMIAWLFEHSREMHCVVGPDGLCKLVNPAWRIATGWAEEELVGRPVVDLVHADDRAGVEAFIAEMARTRSGDHTARLILKGGAARWFEGRCQLTDDGHLIATLRDATAEQARAEELEEARRARALLSEAAGVGVWTFDPISENVFWSDEIKAMTGYDETVVNRMGFIALLHPDERTAVRAAFGAAVQRGASGALEHRLLTADGRWLTLRTTFRTEPTKRGFHVLKGISQDVTEISLARHEAQTNSRRLKMALAAADAGVYEVDHVDRTFWASPELMRMIGDMGDYEDVRSLRFPRFHPDDVAHVRAAFLAIHHGHHGSGEGFEARVLTPEGEERWVRVYHHLTKDAGGRWLKAVGLVQDVDTAKRQELALIEAERAAQAGAEAKAAFLANMSHEIRTPMNGVLGVLHLLKSETLSTGGRELLDEALSCGQMLAELLNDVIDFSKIEAGRLELAFEAVDPRGLIDGVVSLLRPQAEAKGLRLFVETDQTGWIWSDPVRLRQALFNLIEIVTEPCPYCQGKGLVESADTVSLRIERDLRHLASDMGEEAFMVTAHPEVVMHLIGSGGEVIDEIERRLKRAIYVRANEALHIEKYEIVPGNLQEMDAQMTPWRKGETIDCSVVRNPFSMLPKASAWLDGYLVELENGGKYVGRRVKAKLTDIHRSYAFGEVMTSEKSIDKPARS